MLRPGSNIAPRTRFKVWWRLCGSAVEHAAHLAGGALDFQTLFLSQEEDDEETASLADALVALSGEWPQEAPFLAANVARMVNDNSEFTPEEKRNRNVAMREFLFPDLASKSNQTVTSKAVGKRLQRHVGDPVSMAGSTLTLKEVPKPPGKPDATATYFVRVSG